MVSSPWHDSQQTVGVIASYRSDKCEATLDQITNDINHEYAEVVCRVEAPSTVLCRAVHFSKLKHIGTTADQ